MGRWIVEDDALLADLPVRLSRCTPVAHIARNRTDTNQPPGHRPRKTWASTAPTDLENRFL